MRSVVDRNVVMRRVLALRLPSWYAGRHADTPRFVVRIAADKNLERNKYRTWLNTLYTNKSFTAFPQTLQAHARILPQIKPRLFPYTSFALIYSCYRPRYFVRI